jgi:hypothetical protein
MGLEWEKCMSLKTIVSKLTSIAEGNADRAYRILGAHPGPGIDLLIKPQEPLCGKWFVIGKTPAGVAFVEKFWRWQPLSSQKLFTMKKQAADWGITFKTNYPYLSNSTPTTTWTEPL